MASIDERVVSMAFENSAFEQKVAVTMSTLTKLDVAIKNVGHTNGLSHIEADANKVTLSRPMAAIAALKSKLNFGREASQAFSGVEAASNRVNFNNVDRAIDKTSSKFSSITQAAARVDISGVARGVNTVVNAFSILEGAAAVALGSIISKAAMAGAAMAKNLSLGPITEGLKEYETNLNSIQTILANTQQDGTNLQQVNGALQELNEYSDKTIYNFSQMAKNIGTFTAAGVKLKPATESIKGIANLAALSGSNSEQASTAMYQLSQAIAAGKVNLQDWNSVVNAGMGGKVFQKALFDTGKAMGTITNSPVGQTFEQWEKAGNNFRQSLSATQKAAQDGTAALKKAQKEGAEAVKEAHVAASEQIISASERVTEAQKQEGEAIKDAAEKVKQAQEQAANDTKAAAEKVKEAQLSVRDTAKQATADIKAAVDAQKEQTKQSAEDVEAALDAVTAARKRLADAMKPPSKDELQAASDKLKTAQLDNADLATAISDAQTEQKRSAEDLAAAQLRLSEIQKTGGSANEIRDAARAVEDAQRRAADSTDAVERAILRQNAATRDLHTAESDLQSTKQKGTDQDQEVIDSRDALTKATDDYRDAQIKARKDDIAAAKAVSDARKQSTKDQREAGERLAQAEKDQAKVRVQSRKDVQKAEQDERDTIVNARKATAQAEKDYAKTVKEARESEADAIEAAAERVKSARESMNDKDGPPSWLTSDVLTKTLSQFTGDMTDAQLAAMGFTKEQIKAIQQTAKTAKDSATQVKTLSQLFGVVKEAIGTGWADTFKIIFGDFKEARGTFTALSNYIGGFIERMSDARNKVLESWKELGGRTELIEGLKNAFKALMAIVKPIKDAFRDIFPAKTGADLFRLTEGFTEFTKKLIPSKATLEGLRRTFRGFFAALDIGWHIVKELIGVIFDLFGAMDSESGGFLKFTGNIGDMVVSLHGALIEGGKLHAFFKTLGAILKVPIALISDLAAVFKRLFGIGEGNETGKFKEAIGGVGDSLKPLVGGAEKVIAAWDKLKDIFSKVTEVVGPIVGLVGDALSGLGEAISNAFKNIDVDKVLLGLQTGLLAAIALYLKKFLTGGIKFDVGGGFLGKIRDALEGLTGTLKAVQQNLQAGTLLKIGAAIAVLGLAILLLSTIDPDKLKKALAAVAVGLAELVGAMALLTKIGGVGAFATLPIMATGMIILAGAVLILAAAMKVFATMKWEEIAKGFAGVAGALVAVGIGMKTIGAVRLIPIGAGLILVGIALNIIAAAMKIFATMEWKDIGKGLVGIGGGLLVMAGGLALMGPSLIFIGPGLLAAAVGITVMAGAIALFGKMKLSTLIKGIVAMAASIVLLGLALIAMPPGPYLMLQGAGLIVVATAMGILAGAIGLLGRMKLGTIIKGIAGLGATLVILAGGLYLMIGTLPGAAALVVAAAAFAVLAPALALLGSMDLWSIIKALGAMAGILGVLAIGGLIAAPALAALGLAMVPLGLGLLAVGAAVYLAAKGISLLGEQGPKAIAAVAAAIGALVVLLPQLIINFIKGLLAIIEGIAEVAPKVVIALGVIIDAILLALIEAIPKVAEAVGALITAFVGVVTEHSAELIAAGWSLLINFLKGIRDNIGQVVTTVADIIVTFLEKLTVELPRIIAAGANLLVKFLQGIRSQLPQIIANVAWLITTWLTEITKRLPKIVEKAAQLISTFLDSIAKALPGVIRSGVKVIVAFIDGIGDALPRILAAGVRVIKKFMDGVADKFPELIDHGFKAIIKLLNGIEKAIRDNSKELRDAGWGIADAIVDGMLDGFKELWHKIEDLAEDLAKKLPGPFKKVLGIKSPSTVFATIGRQTMEGLAVGLSDGGAAVSRVVEGVAKDVVGTANDEFGKLPSVLDGIVDLDPTIRPVLDLSDVEKKAKQMAAMTHVDNLRATTSEGHAAAVASGFKDISEANKAPREADQMRPLKVEFNQTNTSPESLSDTEIYRQTKNQLGQLKKVLGVPGPGYAV